MLADIYGKSREQKAVHRYRDMYMTMPQILYKYGGSKLKAQEKLGRPDLIVKGGNRTGLYLRSRVEAVFWGKDVD